MKESITMRYPTWSNSRYRLMVLPLVISNLLTSNSIEVNRLHITGGSTISRYLLFDHVVYPIFVDKKKI